MIKRTELVLLGAMVVIAPTAVAAEESITLSPEVAAYVAPVLNAAAAVAATDDATTESAMDDQLRRVLDSRTTKTTEALAVLVGFYIGEAASENISCELIARSKLSLPMLRRYTDAVVVIEGLNTSHVLRRTTTEYLAIIRRIESGEHCARER